MPLWRCYYHMVWATKHRQPLITPQLETLLFEATAHKIAECGAEQIAVNAMPDHIHIAARIPPTILLVDLIQKVKGASSHLINEARNMDGDRFRWQGGYGLYTVSEPNLPRLLDYIANQKAHHRNGATHPALEPRDDE